MEFENITLITSKKGLQKVKVTLEKLESVIPNLSLGKPRYGEIREQILISFRISKEHLSEVIEKLIYNGIKILPTSDEIKDIVDSKKKDYTVKISQSAPGWNDTKTKTKRPSITVSQLEEMSEEGNYEEIIKISKDMINYGQEIVDRAQKVLHRTVFTAIEKAYLEGLKHKINAEESFTKLIRIAGEPALRSMQKTDLIKEAGNLAIELCKKFPDLYENLILIANNNRIHNITNVNAVISFARLIKNNETANAEVLNYAVKEINLRWLSIALDVAQTSLSQNELETFNAFIDFVEKKRAGKTDS